MTKVTVSKLAKPYKGGDYKDPLSKWAVSGPGSEEQHFCTKKDALKYAGIRRNSSSFKEASDRYVRA